MKILFFIPSLSNRGGVERATVALVNALSEENGIDVSLAILDTEEQSAFSVNKKVMVFSLGIIGSYKKNFWTIQKRIYSLIKNCEVNVFVSVESLTLLFSFFPIFFSKKRPRLVVWEHFNFYNNNGLKLRDYMRILAARKADLIVTLTERDEITWGKKLNVKNKVTHVYNISPFNNEKISYNVNSRKAISVGRFVDVKGFDRLIKAWGIAEKNYDLTDWSLDIVGYGDKKSDLHKLIQEEGASSISLVENADVAECYKNASFYCMTSYFEGLPMTMIEAQNFGLPAIAFDIYTGPSEILGDHAGLLVKDGDLEAYAQAINTMINCSEKRVQMSDHALALGERFKASSIVKKWITHFQDILK